MSAHEGSSRGTPKGAGLPLDKMDKEHARRLLHGLDLDTVLGGHGRAGQLHGVEVEDNIQDPVRGTWSHANERGQTVKGRINNQRVAV